MSPTSRRAMRAGFTLIELLVVIAIIAILAAITFPVFPKIAETVNDLVFSYKPSEQDLVGGRVAPPEPNESPLPAPGTFYELNWSVENDPDSNGLSAPLDLPGLGTTRIETEFGNSFDTFGGTLKAERSGGDLLLTSTGEGLLSFDLVDLPFPYVDDVYPPPAFGDDYNRLENMTPISLNQSILIPAGELAHMPTLETMLRQISPRLIMQTGDPVALRESNFGETVMQLSEFFAVPEPAAWMLCASAAVLSAGWRACRRSFSARGRRRTGTAPGTER